MAPVDNRTTRDEAWSPDEANLHQELQAAKLSLSSDRKSAILKGILNSISLDIEMEHREHGKSDSRSFTRTKHRSLPAVLAVLGGVAVFALAVLGFQGDFSQPKVPKHPPNTSAVHVQPYNYQSILGFQPMLPTETLGVPLAAKQIFKFVNPPWGTLNPQVLDSWGKGPAFHADYINPAVGKNFSIIEAKAEAANHTANTPPNIGVPWTTLQKDGQTFYQTTQPQTNEIVIATFHNGLLFLIAAQSKFTPTELMQVLSHMNTPVQSRPDLFLTRAYGYPQALQAAPFRALIPSHLPFQWKTRTALATNVINPHDHEGDFVVVYKKGKSEVTIREGMGIKYRVPLNGHPQNSSQVQLADGIKALQIDGGPGVSSITGNSQNQRVLTWTTSNGIYLTIISSMDVSDAQLLQIANSLSPAKTPATIPGKTPTKTATTIAGKAN